MEKAGTAVIVGVDGEAKVGAGQRLQCSASTGGKIRRAACFSKRIKGEWSDVNKSYERRLCPSLCPSCGAEDGGA